MHSPIGTTKQAASHASEALAFVSELVRLIAPPAGEEEICARGLALTAKTLRASAGTLLLRDASPLPLRVAASVGAHSACDVVRMGEEILSGTGTFQRQAPKAGPTFCLALPLADGAGETGALVLQALDPWDPDHRDMATAAALALAVALRSARLLREARSQKEMLARRNSEARALASLAHAIGVSLDQNRVLEAVGEYARKLLAADRCAIFLSEGTAALRFAHLSGPPVAGLETGDPADFGAAGLAVVSEALVERRAVVVANVSGQWGADSLGARLWGSGSLLLVPLISQERLEGLLTAGRAEPSTWTQDQIELADALAGQAALAIENARLYHEAREALLRLQQAQYGMMRAERLAAVGMLASSLAHEVRNPLNSISLQLVLLSRRVARLADPVGGDLSALVETARREIVRLDSLVEEFLTLSSIDRLSLAEADPAEVVREVTALLAPVARESGILLVESLDAVNQRLLIDREKIKQVLINLIRNSIEAMPQGGRLVITGASSDGSLVIGIQDTGTGIEPGLDVFDFFVTTKRGGTGLGLPIARRIVEAHGGSLTYSSEPGRGTTFEIRLNRDH